MSPWRVTFAIRLIKQLSRSSAKHFLQALTQPEYAQQSVFQRIVYHLKQSAYGHALQINKTLSYSDFRIRVPIVNYDDLTFWITQEKQGLKNILTPLPVTFFEKTSGSSGPAKYIPYNQALLRSFNHLFRIWVYDILSHGPTIETGRIFMSISPHLNEEKCTEGNIPIGLTNDSHYLQTFWRKMMSPFLIELPSYLNKSSVETFRYHLAASLLAEEQLEIISIWNPTYLLILLETITTHRQEFIRDFEKGYFNPLSSQRKKLLTSHHISWEKIWPKLKWISCWVHGTAYFSAKKLATFFPNAFIQGKGLLATEAPLTLPLLAAPGHVPLLNQVFFEFMDNAGDILLLHQLNVGEQYELIISQFGGLYRYRLGDRVRVNAMYRHTPCLEFIGRTQTYCDLVGEKLTEEFVFNVLHQLTASQPLFFMLIPSVDDNGLGQYILLTEPQQIIHSEKLDAALSQHYHYSYARLLGQLKQPKIIMSKNMAQQIQDVMIANGMVWGNIKNKALLTDISLAKHLMEKIESSL